MFGADVYTISSDLFEDVNESIQECITDAIEDGHSEAMYAFVQELQESGMSSAEAEKKVEEAMDAFSGSGWSSIDGITQAMNDVLSKNFLEYLRSTITPSAK